MIYAEYDGDEAYNDMEDKIKAKLKQEYKKSKNITDSWQLYETTLRFSKV